MATSARVKLAKQLFRALQHPDFRDNMPRDRDGTPWPMLTAESTDRLGDLFKQADRIGKDVAIIARVNRHQFCVLALSKHATRRKPGAHPDDCVLHPDIELSMLLMYLRDVKPTARCHLRSPGRKIELVEDVLSLD
jgi:hypothetical protein